MALRHYESLDCALCTEDLEHCHGTAIIGEEMNVCSDDPDCTLAPDLHLFAHVVGCCHDGDGRDDGVPF